MTRFSTQWKASGKPRKQRKYRYTAPLHIKAKFMHVHLSKELAKKYNTRSVQARTGDKVRVMRGSSKKHEGKIESVDIKRGVVFIDKIEITKREGSLVKIPIQPSNIMILELNIDDKKRMSGLTARHKEAAVNAVKDEGKSEKTKSNKQNKESKEK